MDIDVTSVRGRRATGRWERVSVGDLLERVRTGRPGKIAVTAMAGAFADSRFSQLSYARADDYANQVAHALRASGLQPGDFVLMLCENSAEAVLAKLGIAKAGMVAVPVNPRFAADALDHVTSMTQPRLAIVDAEYWDNFEQSAIAFSPRHAVCIEVGGSRPVHVPGFTQWIDPMPADAPDIDIHGDDIWEILFTSGTTAMPKGAMISHTASVLGALNHAIRFARGVRYEDQVRAAAFLPVPYHTGEHVMLFQAFVCGGSAVLARRPTALQMAQAISSEHITVVNGSPQIVESLLEEFEAHPDLDARSLTTINYSWGIVPPEVIRRWKERAGEDIEFFGLLSQTESFANHVYWPGEWPDTDAAVGAGANFVGLPSGMLASRIVDVDGQDAAEGEPGEVVYRSPILSAGYYRDETATRQALRGGWFHSGDSVFAEPSGLRVMVDRIKDMIKSGGENVASTRVEGVLNQHPGVERAAVVGLPHERWGEAVTAFIVVEEGASVDAAELAEHCKGQLAYFERPKDFIVVDELPTTIGGKVRKFKLRSEYAAHYQK